MAEEGGESAVYVDEEVQAPEEKGNWYDNIGLEVGASLASAGLLSFVFGLYKTRSAYKDMKQGVQDIIQQEREKRGWEKAPLMDNQKKELQTDLLQKDSGLAHERDRYAKRTSRAMGLSSGLLIFGAGMLIAGLTVATGGVALAIALAVTAVIGIAAGIGIGKFTHKAATHTAVNVITDSLYRPDKGNEPAKDRASVKEKQQEGLIQKSEEKTKQRNTDKEPSHKASGKFSVTEQERRGGKSSVSLSEKTLPETLGKHSGKVINDKNTKDGQGLVELRRP